MIKIIRIQEDAEGTFNPAWTARQANALQIWCPADQDRERLHDNIKE
jgi:hypothetical protein